MRRCVAMMLLAACGRIEFDATSSPADGGPDAANVRPADFDVDFAGGALGPFTFTRASLASYIDADRQLRYAAVDEPRFDHVPGTGEARGLLIEGSATNLVFYSDQLDAGGDWFTNGTLTVTPDVAIAPDGTMSADEVTEADSGAFNRRGQICAIPNDSLDYVCSAFLKEGTNPLRTFSCELLNGTNIQTEMDVDLSTGTITVPPDEAEAYGITKYGNGWWRVWMTLRNNGSGNDVAVLSVWNYRTDNSVNGSVYVWGAQIEQGSGPTSYIPTPSNATVTRAADSAATSNLDWYDPMAGSLLVSAELEVIQGRNQPAACFVDAGPSYTCVSRYGANGSVALLNQGSIVLIGSPWSGEAASALLVRDPTQVALYDAGRITVDNTPTPPAPYVQMVLGSDSTRWLDGWVRRLAFWRMPLTQAERNTLGVK